MNALARMPDGRIVAGGEFSDAAGVTVRNVAAWDGNGWAPLGIGLPAGVTELAVDATGGLWAYSYGGYFARWDGAEWTFVEVDGSVDAIAPVGDDLIIGGSFSSVGGVAASGLARYRDGTWSAVDETGAEHRISAIAPTSDGYCVAGSFVHSMIGGAIVESAACWDGTAWSALGGPMIGIPSVLTQAPDGRWYIGGGNFYLGDYQTPGIAYLDDEGRWRALDGGVQWAGFGCSPSVEAIVFRGDEVIAGGLFSWAGEEPAVLSLATWSEASGWRGDDPQVRGGVTGGNIDCLETYVGAMLLDDDGGLWIAGDFTAAGGAELVAAANVVYIDSANAAHPLIPPGPVLGVHRGPRAIDARDGVVVISTDDTAGELYRPGLATLDDTWTAILAPPASDLVLRPEGDLILSEGRLLRRFEGAWQEVPTGAVLGALYQGPSGALYALSSVECGKDFPCDQVLAWDGGVMDVIGTADGWIASVVEYDGGLAIGGGFHAVDGVTTDGIAHWQDGSWHPLGDAYPGRFIGAHAMSASDSVGLVAALGPEIMRFDGTRWTSLGVATTTDTIPPEGARWPEILSTAACEDGFFIGGVFDVIGNVRARNVVWNDLDGWDPLGEGQPDRVSALVVDDGSLYAASPGYFESGLQIWDF